MSSFDRQKHYWNLSDIYSMCLRVNLIWTWEYHVMSLLEQTGKGESSTMANQLTGPVL